MMSSEDTSSPLSASTFMYLMRWPVLRLIWLKLIFSESEVAGNNATGQVTRERRKKPFQLARGAMVYSRHNRIQPETISFDGHSTKTRKVNLFRDGERARALALSLRPGHHIMTNDVNEKETHAGRLAEHRQQIQDR